MLDLPGIPRGHEGRIGQAVGTPGGVRRWLHMMCGPFEALSPDTRGVGEAEGAGVGNRSVALAGGIFAGGAPGASVARASSRVVRGCPGLTGVLRADVDCVSGDEYRFVVAWRRVMAGAP